MFGFVAIDLVNFLERQPDIVDRIIAGDEVPPSKVSVQHAVEIYQFHHNPAHRWFYFPDMTRNEALLLKGYDSATDGTARFTAHTAFINPEAPADAPPRESIEVRTFVAFGPIED